MVDVGDHSAPMRVTISAAFSRALPHLCGPERIPDRSANDPPLCRKQLHSPHYTFAATDSRWRQRGSDALLIAVDEPALVLPEDDTLPLTLHYNGATDSAAREIKLIFNSWNLQCIDNTDELRAGTAPWHYISVGRRDGTGSGVGELTHCRRQSDAGGA